jgi:hypothetical protein
MTVDQAEEVDHGQGPEAHQEVVEEQVLRRLLLLAWAHLQGRSCWTALALDPVVVIPDVAETARIPTTVEVHLRDVIAKTGNGAKVSQTTPEKALRLLVLVRLLKPGDHARM